MSLTPQPAFTQTPPTARTAEAQAAITTPTAANAQAQGALDTPTAATGETPFTPAPPSA